MYRRFYHLHSQPFNNSPDPNFLVMLPHVREALAGLEYGISARKGFVVLTGEVGTGKTTLLRSALSSFDPRRVYVSFVFNPGLGVLDFLEFVLSDFGMTPVQRTKSSMLIQLNRWLVQRFRAQDTCVIVVDEAQNLSTELLEEIRLLSNLETSSEKLVQIILSGQPELEVKLLRDDLRQLRQRVFFWCRTKPLNQEQVAGYIWERLHSAGATEVLFPDETVAAIMQVSKGIPRLINLICDHALILGFVDQVRRIPPSTIAAVAHDFRLETPELRASASSTSAAKPVTHTNMALHGDSFGRKQ